MQRASGARPAYGLESARRVPGPDQARAVLRRLAQADDVSRGGSGSATTWPPRTATAGPAQIHAADLREDLHLLAGAGLPAHDPPVVPAAFEHFPLTFLHKVAREPRRRRRLRVGG
ncbi:hypothetical protein ABZ599_18260 [Streptomyces misionensis]|uniref:hypothetical protein n=1 Tax=Streptomyces misionensis TaxID=67331 RepID=UPI0033F2563D